MANQNVLELLDRGAAAGKVSAGAVENIRKWLTEARYAPYAPVVEQHLRAGDWRLLDDLFWTVIPFGTGGRRGRMAPIGSNAINDRTIGESAQGLATYVLEQRGGEPHSGERLRGEEGPSCAIAYDTRHNSRHFAELCAGIMIAAGFRVYFLDDYRSTPELSFLVRHKKCSCGIMVTASHNPPSDNAVKVYWSTGGQILPPHDEAIIERVMSTQDIRADDFARGVSDGRIVICTEEADRAYLAALKSHGTAGPRDIKILYSPMHGVGGASVPACLAADGFESVEVFEPQREPNGDFPNVPDHSANPENPAVYGGPIDWARVLGAELFLATDPDCDRLGCAAPLTLDSAGPWAPFTGNQIGVLLTDYVLCQAGRHGLTPQHYVVKTLVTTEMIRRIADSYGVTCLGDLLVGFKWICAAMDEHGPDRFVFGTEESHGYLVGQYARDKDGAVACMLMAELAALVKSEGRSLHEKLDALYWQHGYHAETLLNVRMEGSEGMGRMEILMRRLRDDPPETLGGMRVAAVRDYGNLARLRRGKAAEPLAGPKGDLVILDFAETGNYVAARPSGTEPKVKFYMFAHTPAEQLDNLDRVKSRTSSLMKAWESDLRGFIATT